MNRIVEAEIPLYVPAFLYEQYEEKIKDRIHELIKRGDLDYWEMAMYERGEGSYEDVYKVAEREACKQIQREILDGGVGTYE